MLLHYAIQHIIIGMWVKLFCKVEYYLTIKKNKTKQIVCCIGQLWCLGQHDWCKCAQESEIKDVCVGV